MWVHQIEAFSDEFQVIAIDLPGHGALREKPFQLTSAIQVVVESLKQETKDRALVVGLSLGGMLPWHAPMLTRSTLRDFSCLGAASIIAVSSVFFLDSTVPL